MKKRNIALKIVYLVVITCRKIIVLEMSSVSKSREMPWGYVQMEEREHINVRFVMLVALHVIS